MLTAALFLAVATQSNPEIDSARGVLDRTLGAGSRRFHLESLPKRADGLDEFTVEAKDNQVTVKGTTPVAICRGAYEFLKQACNSQVGWEGKNIQLPEQLPNFSRHVVGPNRFRHYFNVCTFGYTTVWWDWKRWQREIDWMALHGINMPLAMNGQEKISQTVFKSLGVSQASLDGFFSGPAFLPWQRMGNLNGHLGPLPQSWIDGQADLQKQILGRERSLGMTPVVPGFSGFVPTDYNRSHPGVKLESPTPWAGFQGTAFVSPSSPEFVEIGRRFISEYRKVYGSDHYYLCDTFNEQNPRFPAATESADLTACGQAVYDSIRQADPDGVWVMQGWLFYNAADYWTEPRVEALMKAVPVDRLITLDLATDEHAVWKALPEVRRRPWIYNTLHNYGQSTGLYGDLQEYADRAHVDLTDPNHGVMSGMGLTMEGIDQNPVVYELMTDMMWTPDRVNVDDWIQSYAKSRYGTTSPAIQRAWKGLMKAIYGQNLRWYRAAWRLRPSADKVSQPAYDPTLLKPVVQDLLAEEDRLDGNPLYQRDLVDVTKTWLSALADVQLAGALGLAEDDPAKSRQLRAKFFATLQDLDQVMAARPEHRLSTWLRAANRWGKSPAERALMQENARAQLTIWGGPELFDYANKEWAGLNADFLQGRWHAYFDAQDHQALGKLDLANWEADWTKRTTAPKESKPGDPVRIARAMLARHEADPISASQVLGIDGDPGIAVGKPVRDSGGTESDHRPEFAVDGQVLGNYWSASPTPQWLEIDLKKPETFSGVWLFTYFGDGRYYQYKVETSLDDKTWTTQVDESSNEKPASLRGYRHKFAATSARYVRVTMAKNSANIGAHLYEVRVLR